MFVGTMRSVGTGAEQSLDFNGSFGKLIIVYLSIESFECDFDVCSLVTMLQLGFCYPYFYGLFFWSSFDEVDSYELVMRFMLC